MSDDALVQLCVVRLGDEAYAVDLRRVDEILPVPAITPVPRAPGFLEGVARLRGEVLPVVDARKRLGLSGAHEPSRSPTGRARRTERLVVCRIGRRRIGFLVDAVLAVRRVPRQVLRPAPLAARPGVTPHVLGVVGEGPQLTLLLDVKALIEEERP